MKLRIYYLLFFMTLCGGLLAQSEQQCQCEHELDWVAEKVKASKSYKQQIKGKKETEFEEWKAIVREEIRGDEDINFYCVGYLQKFVFFIKDSHNRIKNIEERNPLEVPDYSIDTNLIRSQYQDNPVEVLEGFYAIGQEKIVILPIHDSLWYGVIVSSGTELWKTGMVRLKIVKTKDHLEMFEFQRNGKLFFHKEIKVEHGRIYPTFWNKTNEYHFHNTNRENFFYQAVNESTDYISINSFDRTRKLMAKAQAFYENVLPKLTKEYLIIDFRNNTGGSTRQADPLVAFLKKDKQVKKIFVVINCFTGSATEITTSKLMKDNRVVIVGENSRGILAYGYGNGSISDPAECFNYRTSFTVNNSGKDLLQYEGSGIPPDIYLDIRSNWIDQIKEIIEKEKDE